MDLADFMGAAGIVKNSFRNRRFTGIDMGDDADISDVVDLGFFLHRINSISALTGSSRSTCPARVGV